MRKREIELKSEYDYWSQVSISLSQITFGAAWALFFLPIDIYKMLVIGLNLVITGLLLLFGWFLRRLR